MSSVKEKMEMDDNGVEIENGKVNDPDVSISETEYERWKVKTKNSAIMSIT